MPQSIADDFKAIPMSSNLGESLERAHRFAREQSHRTVMLEHLLLALTEDPEASIILQAANVDLSRLRGDVSSYLGRLHEDMRAGPGAEPRPDPELLRVLQAAASAAQQSKRRQIDGAIVLAAVVGDGKSPAAGTLKAHGMTFEEAIRALQRANTQARLKPKPAPAAPSAPQQEARAPEPAPAAEEPKPAAPAEAGGSLSARLAPHGTADDILAAARARIQQRASAATSHLPPAPEPMPTMPEPPEPPMAARAAPHVPQAPMPDPQGSAFEDLLAASGPTRSEPAAEPYGMPQEPPLQPDQRPRQSWTPAPDMRPQGQPRHPQPPMGRAPNPVPPQRGPGLEDQMRQPQGPRPRPGQMPAGGGGPGRPARAPWPEPAEHSMRGPASNGVSAPFDAPLGAPAGGPAARPAPRGSTGDRGPLVESVPRRMRVGVASKAEVRISRDRIEGLVAALGAHGQPRRPEQPSARALSVRLKAPNAGFIIESVSPETQWVDAGFAGDEFAVWRWTVIPQRRGKARLLLVVSARTVGHDGLAAESSPPDRVIDVRVAPNRMRSMGRWFGLLVAMAIGAALGRYGEQLWSQGFALIKKLTAG